MTSRIRVVLAEDHAILRQALAALLEQQREIEIVGLAADGFEAERLVSKLRPDVLVLDVSMPRRTGLQVIASLKHANSTTRILVLTMHSDSATLRAALDAGTDGYVLKDTNSEELVKAIVAVARGTPYVSVAPTLPEATSNLVEPPLSDLTQREREVLGLLARGHTNKEIAQLLGITVKTAETHRQHLTEKLGRRSRAQLVEYAAAVGLV